MRSLVEEGSEERQGLLKIIDGGQTGDEADGDLKEESSKERGRG